ncbi:hypothetical protein Tco_1499057 [Tanacetum coccineum]
MTLFGQDNETFTSTMSLNLDQLQRQLDKDEFQEDKSMGAFWVLNNQFQKFIDWQHFLDYDNEMTEKLFPEYTRIQVKQFRETLLLHLANVKKSVAERNTIIIMGQIQGGEIDQDAEHDQVKSPLLKAEFLKMNDMVEKEVYNELSNRFLQLEKHCISLGKFNATY